MATTGTPESRLAMWRAQEQRLVARWEAAMEQNRVIQAEMTSREGAPDEDLAKKAKAALEEIDAVRKQVARFKREYATGARY